VYGHDTISNMKIMLDARMYGTEHTGIGRYVMSLVTEIGLQDITNEYLILLREPYFSSIELPHNFTKVKADIPHYSFAEQFILPFIIESYQPDIVHFMNLNVPLITTRPYIVTIHDLTMQSVSYDASTLHPLMYRIKHLALKLVTANAVYRSSKIICPSRTVKKDIEHNFSINPTKTVSIYEGVNVQRSLKPSSVKGKYLLYVGNAYPHKNVELLVQAAKELPEDIRIVFVIKKGAFASRVKALSEKLKLGKRVVFLDQVSEEDLSALYAHCLAFVFPSKKEGFGLTGLEAMSQGTIVCASDIDVFHEIYANNAFYFDPNSISSLVKCLSTAFELSSARRKELISIAALHAQKYTWHKTAKMTLFEYNEIVTI
jgi:glycosyltransferase involved in cell wall biosynthesis